MRERGLIKLLASWRQLLMIPRTNCHLAHTRPLLRDVSLTSPNLPVSPDMGGELDLGINRGGPQTLGYFKV